MIDFLRDVLSATVAGIFAFLFQTWFNRRK